jgi:hypothetical protein
LATRNWEHVILTRLGEEAYAQAAGAGCGRKAAPKYAEKWQCERNGFGHEAAFCHVPGAS